MYTMGLDLQRHGSPASFAEKCRRYNVRWVCPLLAWQSGDGSVRVVAEALEAYAEALFDAGVDVWVCGYPWAGHEEQFVGVMSDLRARTGARGVVLDPELPYKDRPNEMRRLLALTLDSLDESSGLGFTSFGVPKYHRTFPWEVAGGWGWGSPQIYTVSAAVGRAGIQAWRDLGWEYVVPSVPTFGPRSGEKLREYLQALGPAPAICAWVWRATGAHEWRTLRDWQPSP
jgi:hypothetical protein